MKNQTGLLQLWDSVGRASETACLTWDDLEWDDEFNCVFVVIKESKLSKIKLIAFAAGVDRHCCFFLAQGNPHQPPMWLYPLCYTRM